MIAELFYPKELKEIIADLRAKDDLNEGALKRMNRHIRQRVIIGIGFSLVIFILSLSLKDVFAILFISILVLYSIYSIVKDIHTDLNTYPILYSVGGTTEGVVTRMFDTGLITVSLVCAWGINYNYTVSNKNHSRQAKNLKNYFKRDKYQVDQNINIFYDYKNPEKSIPYVSSLYPLFNLKKQN